MTLAHPARPRLRLPLRITIPVGVVAITVTLAATLGAVNYVTSARAVQAFTGAVLSPIAGTVAEKTQAFLDACGTSAALAADLAAEADPATRLDAFEVNAFALLRERPELFYVQFGDRAGNFQIVERAKGGGLDSRRVRRGGGTVVDERTTRAPGASLHDTLARREEQGTTYDPRERPWYQGALDVRDPGRVFWTEVYTHEGGQRVITAARAVRRDRVLVGVASATVSVELLSDFLDTIRLRDRPARVFLVDRSGTVVASSAATGVRSRGTLVKLAASDPPELTALARTAAFRDALAGGAGGSMGFAAGDDRWLGVLRPLPLTGGLVVGAVVPEDDFVGEVKAGFGRSLVVGAGVIIVFVFLGLLLSTSIARALHGIAVETSRLRNLDLDDRPLPDTVFQEVAEINDVYQSLKVGLRAFEKYVPTKLVRMLIAEGTEPVLGGRLEELTLFFSDVRGFTAYAEGQDPAKLAGTLGRYLSTMAETVGAHGGTVDKFMGDAVMAFWNAPRPVEDHAFHAVVAAIDCRDKVREMGLAEALFTRIGIHTARVMVGNFGAPERLAYTVLGDGVNLAARMEGVNKEYGTQILITEATFQAVAGRVACRRVDRIAVKGRTEPTDIYEVLGEEGDVEDALVEAARVYEAALEAYLARDFAAAAAGFARAQDLRPEDLAATLMRERAEAYVAAPPGDEWTGVFTMTSK